jgi:hypothetical protein
MIAPSEGSRAGGFGGEEFGAVAGGTAGDVADDEGGADEAVAEAINGLDCGSGFLAGAKAGDAVWDEGFEILGPGERCSTGGSAAGRFAGMVDGTAAETRQ